MTCHDLLATHKRNEKIKQLFNEGFLICENVTTFLYLQFFGKNYHKELMIR